MSLEWESLFDAELKSALDCLQEEAAVVEDAERCRTQSSSEDELPMKITAWWARLLETKFTELGYDLKAHRERQKEVTVISGCTGCSAEAATMEATECQNFSLNSNSFALEFEE